MNPCACTDIVRCAACEPYECNSDEHYCPPWLDAANNGPLFCRCGQALRDYEDTIPDGDGEHVWFECLIIWAASDLDADPYVSEPQHDVWQTNKQDVWHIARADGRCQLGGES